QAFRNCSSLTNLVIPEGVQSINQEVFFGCSSLKSLSLPSTLTYITFMPITGDSAFSGCSNLTEVNVSPDNRRYCSVDGVVYTKDKKGLLFYPTGLQGKYEIPAGVVYIGEYAFSGHSGITELVFSSEIQNIGRAAFRHADSLIYVFYKGSEADWKKVNNYGVNEALDSSIMHYNSTDHTFDPDTVIKKESCREAGIARLKCSVCGEVKYELIPATGHKWDTGKITKAATCAEEGARQYTCATCGETRTEPIPITDHHYSITQIISPSCKQEGYTMHICDVCGSSYGDTVIHATDHIWESGKVTQQPTVSAEGIKIFTCTVCGETRTEAIPKLEPKPDDPPTPPTPGNPFADVASGEYFYDPVLWAVNHTPQITNGTSRTTFSPNATCTRGQVVTFLWRAMGEPEPTSAVNKFTDVQTSDYFYKAVLWAVEKGITVGTSDTTFSPNDPCTRAHVVTFLWRAEEQPSVAGANPFADVASGHYYYSAVLWAVSKNITQGTSASTFSPDNPCTRAQIVTFLYRDMK
ncbi:MAG: S-layer homology domain-containing protein, partial [Clostridia bacterium]|nr:S-layer homology domain-containing protein [Clostridia bacterium]